MKIGYLRASSIESYSDCEWKFFLFNCCGFISKPNKKAYLGTIAHHVLELLAKARKNGYTKLYGSFRTDPEKLLKICWDHYSKEKNDFDLLEEDYNFCRTQVELVLNSKYNPLLLKPIKTEHQFQIEINRPGFTSPEGKYMELRGTIDLITELTPDCLEIIDYKTGERKDWITGKPKEFEDFLKNIQFRVYNIATSRLYEKYKFKIFTMIFTRDGGPFSISFDVNEIENTLDILRRKYSEIIENNHPKRILKNRDRFTETWKCDYVCQFGRVIHKFISEDGDIIEQTFKIIQSRSLKYRDYPSELMINNKKYVRFTNSTEINRVCDKYYQIYKEEGLDKAQIKLQQISLDENLQEKISRRNNYESNKIDKVKYDIT